MAMKLSYWWQQGARPTHMNGSGTQLSMASDDAHTTKKKNIFSAKKQKKTRRRRKVLQ
jgi:hypothetical protein